MTDQPITAATLPQIIARARPGTRIEYYRGQLAIECDPFNKRLPRQRKEELCNIRKTLQILWERRRVHLVQRPLGLGVYAYIAIVRPEDAVR